MHKWFKCLACSPEYGNRGWRNVYVACCFCEVPLWKNPTKSMLVQCKACIQSFVFCVMFCRSLFVLFLLAIMLSVLWFTVFNYPFGVFKRFLGYNCKQSQSIWLINIFNIEICKRPRKTEIKESNKRKNKHNFVPFEITVIS
jgi:hypothetical protein